MSKIVSVFGAHTPERGSPDYATARDLGFRLGEAGFTVATGGYEGTMAAVSEGAYAAGGKAIGVTSKRIEQKRGTRVNSWVTEVIVYESLQERLLHLVTKNDAMVVLPGGVGTLTELALSWNLMQVSEVPPKPLLLLGPMWHEVMSTFIRPEFVHHQDREFITFSNSPQEVVESLITALSDA